MFMTCKAYGKKVILEVENNVLSIILREKFVLEFKKLYNINLDIEDIQWVETNNMA